MIKEFKDFVMKGNLLELAVAFIMGVAFAAVVTSFTADVITPIVAAVVGQPDFSSLTINIGDSAIFYGSFLNTVITFVIVAFVLFLIIKAVNTLVAEKEDDEPSDEVKLLTEIRDALARR